MHLIINFIDVPLEVKRSCDGRCNDNSRY